MEGVHAILTSCLTIYLLIIFTCGVSSTTFTNGIEVNRFNRFFKNLANTTSDWLTALHARTTHIQLLETDLDYGPYADLRLRNEPFVQIKPVYLQQMVENMAKDIQEHFAAKRRALEDIVELLEDATTTYLWDDNLQLNTSRPLLMKDPTNFNTSQLDPRLGVLVRHNASGIHVPLEVYEGYPEILNGVKWSSAVDQVFQENYEKDPTLMWQYFAAQTGFMRVYPATSWYVPPSLVDLDLYDARLRPWYVQGSVSPKDMIILMDRSGSVHGQTFTIMKWAVKTLIDTLGENDYVNVAAFNDTTEWVNNCTLCEQLNATSSEWKECTQPFIQATTSNKKLLFRAIDDLEDGGMASYSKALTFAYEAFKNFEDTRSEGEGANCLKTIMLFSDGGTEWPEKVIEKYLADNFTKSVRIFTYAVGPHPIPTAVLKQMACSTGGMYSVITTRSSIRTKIQESYTSILATDQPLNGFNTDQYTTTYSSAVTEQLTVSLTRPVYNNSYLLNSSYLLGVAGIDVPIKSLNNLSPFESLGPNGYSFMVNNNGFLILHPKLQKQLSYLSAPPHIDILDLEEDTPAMSTIRTNLIDRRSETVQVSSKIRIDDHHLIVHNETQFAYTPIHNTPYSLGLVNLKNSHHMVGRVPDSWVSKDLNFTMTLFAPWPYCNNRENGDDSILLINLKGNTRSSKIKCNNDLVHGLRWSENWSKQMHLKWQTDHTQDFTSRVVFTRFGHTRFYPPAAKLDVKAWRNPWKNPALRRGEVTSGVSVIPHTSGSLLSAPIVVRNDKVKVMAGVVGVNFTANSLRYNFRQHLTDAEWLKDEHYLVMLLDDGGMVVTANREELNGISLQGRFIGDLPIPLLTNLKDEGIYEMDIIVDKQALCKHQKHFEVSSGPRSYQIPNVITVAFNLLLEVLSWAEYLKYIIYSSVVALLAPSVDAWTEWGMTQIGGLETCTMERAVYYFGEVTSISGGSMKCSNASEKVLFWAHRVPDTNALLVAIEMSESSPECGVFSDLPSIKPKRVTEFAPCAYHDRYRNQPTTYMSCNATVGDSGCNRSPRQVEMSIGLLLLMLLLTTNSSSIRLHG